MYVILVYDISGGKVGKALKICRQYLNWIQNSVFEGELNSIKYKELISKLKMLIDTDTDSIIVFKSRQEKWLDKEVFGIEKNDLDNFL